MKTKAELLKENETLRSIKGGPVIQVGATGEAITAAHSAIMSILESRADEKTKRFALDTLTGVCSIDGTHISHCNFNLQQDQAE